MMFFVFRRSAFYAILLSMLLLPSAVGAQTNYTLQPLTPSVKAGDSIEFVGTGFIKGERVSSWATGPDEKVIGGDYTVANGQEGRIELVFRVPGNAIGGRWALTAYGEYSKTPVVTTFEVIGRTPPASIPPIRVSPSTGGPGTTFSFFASGFRDEEKISYWATAPDGKVYGFAEEAEATSEGHVYFDWTAPADAISGTWAMTVQGVTSGRARAITVEIRR